MDSLVPAVQAAIREWTEAQAADTQHQQTLAEVRWLAASLQQEPVTFRRASPVHASWEKV